MRIVVDTAGDVISENDGVTSFREAIMAASSGLPTLITFDPNVFGAIADASGNVTLNTTLAMQSRIEIGEGVELVIDGALGNGYDLTLTVGGDRFFDILPEADVTLRDLKLAGGFFQGENGTWGQYEVDGVSGGILADSNEGEPGQDGKDSESGAFAGETAVAGIENAGSLTLERVHFTNLEAVAGDGGRGGDGGGGGHGGNGRLVQSAPTGELVSINQPSAYIYDNANPVVVPSEPLGDGGRGGDGGDGSDGGNGGLAVGGILNTGSLVMRDVSFGGVSVTGGRGGNGGTGGKGGDGGEESAVVDPGWPVRFTEDAYLLQTRPVTQESYDGIPWFELSNVTPFTVLRSGVTEIGPGIFHYGPIGKADEGAGGDSGDGGDAGNGGNVTAGIHNIGSVTVEGAQSQIGNAAMHAGSGGIRGSSRLPGLPGYWDDPREFEERDVEFEWGYDRPFSWSDSMFRLGGDPDLIGTRGEVGLDGAEGIADEFFGVGVETVANTFIVEAVNGAIEEGDALRFLFTRRGDPFVAATIAYTVTMSHGLDNADFASPMPLTGSLSFAPGQTGKVVTLQSPLDDGIDEGTERLTVTLSGDSGIGFTGAATVLIGDPGEKPTLTLGTDASETLFAKSDVEGLGGDDRIFGSASDDRLDGGAGDDFIRGDAGDDTLIGGAGADTLSFAGVFGDDVVTDFDPSEDRIEIDMAHGDLTISQQGADTRVSSGANGGTITLQGVSANDLTAAHFDLVELPAAPGPAPDTLSAADDAFATVSDPVTGNLFADNGNGADQPGVGGTLRVVSVDAGGTSVPLGTATALPSGATLTVQQNGDFTFDPGSSGAGTAVFSYTVADSVSTARPAAFEAVVDLSGLAAGTGTNGFVLGNAEENDLLGIDASAVGDVNNDGIDDFIVTARGSAGYSNNVIGEGRAYLVYGTTDGFPLSGGLMDIGALDFGDGSAGALITGLGSNSNRADAVAGGGDFNNDGISDFAIAVDLSGSSTARTYVVYGQDGGFAAPITLSDLATGDGSAGFVFETGDDLPGSLALGGDVTGDGIDDLIVGSPYSLGGSGSAFVLYGGADGPAGILAGNDILNGDGSQGYGLIGIFPGDLSGRDVDFLGDVNGDGVGDFIVGATGANISSSAQGRTFVLFGNDNRFGDSDGRVIIQDAVGDNTPNAGVNGFSVDATGPFDTIGLDVAGAGDINADGIPDIILGDFANERALVIFGSDSGFPLTDGRITHQDLLDGDGSAGFVLQAPDLTSTGFEVRGVGDVNNDGIDDIAVAATLPSSYDNQIFVVYGSDSGFNLTGAEFDLDALAGGDGTDGFVLRGFSGMAPLSQGLSGPGDFDGDGVSDMLFGVALDNSDADSSGRGYVVFGRGAAGGGPAVPTDSADVTITVGQAPVELAALPQTYAMLEDGTLTADLGDGTGYSAQSAAQNGTVTVSDDGSFTYTPDADFNGSDSFLYAVNGASALVGIEVSAVNDAPVLTDDTATTDEATPVTIDVLANDTDPDGDVLSVVGVSGTARGSVSLDQDGVTFDPGSDFLWLAAGQSDTESFDVTVSDGTVTRTSSVTVTVTGIDGDPVLVNDLAQTVSGGTVSVDVLANDVPTNGPALTLVSASFDAALSPAALAEPNSVQVSGGQVVFTAGAGFTGTSVIDYVARDGTVEKSGKLSIDVAAAPDAPVAVNDTATVGENDTAIIDVLANDSDPNGAPLTVLAVNGPPAIGASVVAGGIRLAPGPAFDSLAEGETQDVALVYSIGNGTLESSGLLTVTVIGANDAPVAEDDQAEASAGLPVTIDVLANDSDVDGDTLTLVSVSAAANGVAGIQGDQVVYTPDAGFEGVETLSYTISDGTETASAEITVTVTQSAVIIGTPGPDFLPGTPGDDDISGLEGADTILADAGNDTVDAGPGRDVVSAGTGDDIVEGGLGADMIGGDGGNDLLDGGGNHDTIGGGSGDDTLIGGDGNDLLSGGSGHDVVTGQAGDDTLRGGSGSDILAGGDGDDVAHGGAGDDMLGGGAGNDLLAGEAGNDTVSGGAGDDTVGGGGGDDFVTGGAGDDLVVGGAGDDTVNGGDGADVLVGGAGADIFVFVTPDAGVTDTIADFEDGTDMIRLVGFTGTDAENLAVLQIADTATGAEISYGLQSIHVLGTAAAQLGLDDFDFV